MSHKLPYASDGDYWKTGSKRTATHWIELAKNQLIDHGATNVVTAQGEQDGQVAFMIEFTLMGERYRLVWPVLPLAISMQTESNRKAAEVQAATSLYHEVKSCCVKSTRYGSHSGFFQFQLLPNGVTVQQMTATDLMHAVPRIMSPMPMHQPRIAE